MGTLGPNGGTVFSSDPLLGLVAVSNPSNAATQNGVYATSLLLLGQDSNCLTAMGFRFAIPNDATITGITVNIIRSGSVLNAIVDNVVKLIKGGVMSGTNKAAAGGWSTSDMIINYGSNIDIWGISLTPADVNADDFGIAISGSAVLLGTMQIDYVSITIDYSGSNRSGNSMRQFKVGDGISRSDEAI